MQCNNGIMIVGEAHGRHEEEAGGKPFVGPSGHLLRAVLSKNGIEYYDCYVTNVFNFRPKPTNDIKNLCGKKADGIKGWPALAKGKYAKAAYTEELERLLFEVRTVKPQLIIALGATATWALLKTSGIKGIRGAPMYHRQDTLQIKVLPTYHPAALFRNRKQYPIFFADIYKARKEMEFPEIRRPQREIWIEPTLADLHIFYDHFIKPEPFVSVDIENPGGLITCIGFASTPDRGIVVPFYDHAQPDHNYWRSLDEEVAAWAWIKKVVQSKPCIGQNFLYDVHHLWRQMGITVKDIEHDTMLLHHALQPEMEKSLDFMASVYTDEAKWKFMRRAKGGKRED